MFQKMKKGFKKAKQKTKEFYEEYKFGIGLLAGGAVSVVGILVNAALNRPDFKKVEVYHNLEDESKMFIRTASYKGDKLCEAGPWVDLSGIRKDHLHEALDEQHDDVTECLIRF